MAIETATTPAAEIVGAQNTGPSFDDLAGRLDDHPLPAKPQRSSAKSAPKVLDFDALSKKLDAPDDSAPTPGIGGSGPERQDPTQYGFDTKFGQDNDLLRAQNQSWEKQLGLGLANLVPNIATGIGQSIGQLGTLMQFGDDRTYDNSLTQTMEQWHNPFGEIYQEHPNETFDLKDPAWWVKQGSGLAEMTGQFAALGAGVGGLIEKGVLGIADIANAGRLATTLLKTAGQVATSGALSYTIGASMGAEVYKKAYATNLQRLMAQGIPDEQAHTQATHIAAQAAASTVQLNTALGFGLNLTSVLPVFKQADEVLDYLRTGPGARVAGESLTDWKARLAGLGIDDSTVQHLVGANTIGHQATEALKQSAEGIVMHFSKQTGNRIGDSGQTKGFLDQFGELSHLFDDATTSEGALNAILGVAGGVFNTHVMENIPMHRDYVRQGSDPVPVIGEDGKPQLDDQGQPIFQTKMYSSRAMAKNQRMSYFENARDAVVTDIDHVSTKMAELQQLAKDGKVDEAQKTLNDLLAVQQLHAIVMGTHENLKAEYKGIQNADNHTDLGKQASDQADQVAKAQQDLLEHNQVDSPDKLPDELKAQFDQLDGQRKDLLVQSAKLSKVSPAMQAGYTTSMEDDSYKTKAADAISDMDTFAKWSDEQKRNFAYDPRNEEVGTPQIVLHKLIQSHLYDRLQRKLDAENLAARTNLDSFNGPELSTDQFNGVVQDYNRKIVQNTKLADYFSLEHTKLREAVEKNDVKAVTDMLDKYRIDYPRDKVEQGAIDLSKKLVDLHNQKAAQAVENHKNLGESLQFQSWSEANGGKGLDDYIKELHKRTIDSEQLRAKEFYAEQLRAEHGILKGEINKIQSNPRKFGKSVLQDFDSASKASTQKIKDQNEALRTKDREVSAATKIDEKTRQRIVEGLEQKTTDLESQIKAQEVKIASMSGTTELSKLGKMLKWVRDPDLKQAQEELNNMKAQLDFYKDKLSTVLDPIPTPENEDAEAELSAVPDDIANRIVDVAGKINNQMTIDDIRSGLKRELALQGIDESTLTQDSVDALIVRAMAANKKANERDNSETVNALDVLINSTGNPALVRESVDALFQDPSTFNWNHFQFEQAVGFLDAATAAKILQKVKDLIDGADATTEDTTLETGNEDKPWENQGTNNYRVDIVPNASGTFGVIGSTRVGSQLVANDALSDYFDTRDEAEEFAQQVLTQLQSKYGSEDTPETTVPEVPLPDEDQLPKPDDSPDQPVVGRASRDKSKPIYHSGTKTTNAVSIRRLDLNYSDGVRDNPLTDDQAYTIGSTTSVINRTLSEEMLQHGKIKEGSTIKLVVDKEWKGSIKSDTKANTKIADSFDNYIDKDGKVPINAQNLVDEVPIKIVNEKGETLGYLPRVGWVLSQYEGAAEEGSYRNIGTVISPEGVVISNAETEAERLRVVRAQVVKFFNSGSSDIGTSILDRGPGHLIENVDEKGFTKPDSAAKLLPSKDLEFGIADHGVIKTGKTTTSEKQLDLSQMDNLDFASATNSPYAVVPLPNGRFGVAPLYNRGIEPHETKTMLEAIRVYLSGDQKGIDAVQKHTGYDISTAEGLRNFIAQHYTYTNRFSEATLKPSIDEGATPKFLFNIANEVGGAKGSIDLGTAYSGRPRISALLQGGELNRDFVAAFERGMKGRYKNIVFDDASRGMKGLNSSGPVNEVVFSRGNFKIRATHESYNDYVKSFSETPIDGRNQLKNGEHVYAVHASANLDMNQVIEARPDKRAKTKIPDSAIPTSPEPTGKQVVNTTERYRVLNIGNLHGQDIGDSRTIYFADGTSHTIHADPRFAATVTDKYIIDKGTSNERKIDLSPTGKDVDEFRQDRKWSLFFKSPTESAGKQVVEPYVRSAAMKEVISLYTGGSSYFNISQQGSEVAENLRVGGITPEEVFKNRESVSGKLGAWFERGYESMTGKTYAETEAEQSQPTYDPWDPRHPDYVAPKPTFSQEDADLLDGGFMDYMPNLSQPGLTLQNLEELHTFTPEESHNGKTTTEVLAEMKQLGLNHLPENFNPFLKC